MIVIARSFEWDAGHRILNHESKCRYLHGHRYRAEVEVTAPELDSLGRVIDFSVLKARIGEWIDTHWDHNLLLHSNDPLIHAIRILCEEEDDPSSRQDLRPGSAHDDWSEAVFGRSPYIFSNSNPTAENIATELHSHSARLLADTELTVVGVRVWETPNCWALSVVTETSRQKPGP